MKQELIKSVEDLVLRGKLDEACELSARAAIEADNQSGRTSASYARALMARAYALGASGQLDKAHSLCEEAVGLFENVSQAQPLDLSKACLLLGDLTHARGNAETAELYIRKALDLSPHDSTEGAAQRSHCLLSLGKILEDHGSLPEAETAYRQSLEIARQRLGNEHHQTIAARNALGWFLLSIDQYDEATAAISETYNHARTVLPEYYTEVITAISNMGLLQGKLGRLNEAEAHLRIALNLTEKYRGVQSLDVAHTSSDLGRLLIQQGKLAEAEALISNAMANKGRILGEKHPVYAQSLSDMGTLMAALADYDRAIKFYSRAYEIDRHALGDDHPNSIHHLKCLGDTYCDLEEEGRAAEAYGQAADIADRVFGVRHVQFAECVERMATLMELTGKLAEAIEFFERAAKIYRNAGGENHIDYANCIINRANALAQSGQFHDAKVHFEQAVDIFSRLGAAGSPLYSTLLLALAAIAVSEQRHEHALSLAVEAMNRDRVFAHHVFAVSSESQREHMLQQVEMYMAIIVSLCASCSDTAPEAAQCALDAVLQRKGLDGEIHLAQRVWSATGQDAAMQQRLDELRRLRHQLATLLYCGSISKVLSSSLTVEDLMAKMDDIEGAIARDMPIVELSRRLERANADEVIRSIPEQCALVEFIRVPIIDLRFFFEGGDDLIPATRYFAIVAKSCQNECLGLFDLGDADPIDAMVSDLRQTLIPKDNAGRGVGVIRERVSSDFGKASLAISEAVFDPLVSAVCDSRHLILAPDGELNLLSFCILPCDQARCLVDCYTISYVGSGRELVRFGENETHTTTPPVVIADPDFGCSDPSTIPEQQPSMPQSRIVRFPPLPGTRKEAERVADLLPKSLCFLDKNATAPRLLACTAPLVLHVATHGFFCSHASDEDEMDPEECALLERISRVGKALDDAGMASGSDLVRSGLVFAGVNIWANGQSIPEEMGTGVLTALDVLGANLLGTELVVLSACDTGLGLVRRGEGVFGLRRAFTLAGAKSLVMSLWRIGDDDTQSLMLDFYERLLRGQPVATALRDAQLVVKSRHSDPAIWGAFICQGDPGPAMMTLTPDR